MIAVPYTRFGRPPRRALLLSLLLELLVGGILLAIMGSPAARAGPLHGCEGLDQEKWRPYPHDEDFSVLLLDLPSSVSPRVSPTACWACALWVEEPEAFPALPDGTREMLLFQEALCYRTLGMEREAIQVFRRLLRRHPHGKTLSQSLASIIEILFHQGNHSAVVDLYLQLGPEQREALLPETRYLVGQSYYVKGQDRDARSLLAQVPRGADVFPYALYTRAQTLFRAGNANQAVELLQQIGQGRTDPPAPGMLRDLATLTAARIRYQQDRYEDALAGFRSLNRSSYFLPEALMGMGWSYEALGDLPKAIAYFRAVESSDADVDTLTEAHLEAARLLSEAEVHEDAFLTYRTLLNDLHARISRYRKYGQDPEWLAWLANQFLDSPRHRASLPREAPVMAGDEDLPLEMDSILERRRFTSARMKALLAIRSALDEIELQADRLAGTSSQPARTRAPEPVAYPPLVETPPFPGTELFDLLDLLLGLLDTEYRLIDSGSMLGLLEPGEKSTLMDRCLEFYRGTLEALLLPGDTGGTARQALSRLEVAVRYLPYPVAQKERILTKLIHAAQSLRQAEGELNTLSRGIGDLRVSETQPARPLLLRKWMVLVRTLVYLHNWEYRSPVALMNVAMVVPARETGTGGDPREALRRATERWETTWDWLLVLATREIGRIHRERRTALEELLVRSQFEYADALVRHQERILKAIQSLPAGGHGAATR